MMKLMFGPKGCGFELLIGDAYKTNLGSFFGSSCVVNDKEDLNLLMCGSTGGLWIIIHKPNMFNSMKAAAVIPDSLMKRLG